MSGANRRRLSTLVFDTRFRCVWDTARLSSHIMVERTIRTEALVRF